MMLSRRGFVLGVVGVIVTHHRPNHKGGPTPTPTPTEPPAWPAFVTGRSFAGGPDLVGGNLTGG
jgi:hypothetical protein